MATRLQAPVAIADPIRKDVAEGKFTLSLPHCELRQCGADTPLVLAGVGFVDQGPDGDLALRMFVTEKHDVRATMKSLGFGTLTSGVIIPTSEYYDVSATAQNGATWRAERQSINPIFGAKTEVRVALTHWEKVDMLPRPAAVAVERWFIQSEFELPWHMQSGDRRDWARDLFAFDDDDFAWALQKEDGGVNAQFTAKRQPLEPHATRFMRALEMLRGRSLRPLITSTVSGKERTFRIHRRPKPERLSLGPPIDLGRFEPGDAHRFIACCLHLAKEPSNAGDPLLTLYRFWWRILRAHQGDIENSSLVLSVAIEGVLKALFPPSPDANAEFRRLVDAAKPAIGSLEVDERVRSSLLASLNHAIAAKPRDAMMRLEEQGVLEDTHIDAWKALRNAGAHGALLEDDDDRFQRHIDRFFCCLDMFYHLVFTVIGYRGGFIDYSARDWPPSTFPPGAGSDM